MHSVLRVVALALACTAGALGCAAARVASAPITSVGGGAALAATVAREEALLAQAAIEPTALRCSRDNRWGNTIRPDASAGADDLMSLVSPKLAPLDAAGRAELHRALERSLMWRMVRAVLLEGDNNNFGVLPLRGRSWRDAAGVEHPVLIFRTGFTPTPGAPGSCVASLLDAGAVKHVVNLFDGDIPAADLVEGEARAAAAHGATYHTATDATDATAVGQGSAGYGPWRDQLRKHWDDPAVRATATGAVARLVREQILMPDGKAPRGNLHVHCGGGMHRTGMIIGVVERCVNREPMERVEASYRQHVGWRDAEHPGGYEEGNVRFLREFDCALLEPVGAAAE